MDLWPDHISLFVLLSRLALVSILVRPLTKNTQYQTCYMESPQRDYLNALQSNTNTMRVKKKLRENFQVRRAFLRPDGNNRWFGHRSITHIALLLSEMVSLIQISKSCSKVIHRTLQSDNNWMRNSSFGVISRVKFSVLLAWPIFEYIKFLKLTMVKHENVSKKTKKISKQERSWIVQDAPRNIF